MKDTIIFVEFDQRSFLEKTCSLLLNPFSQPAEVTKTPACKWKETLQKLKKEVEEICLVSKILDNPKTNWGYQESFSLDAKESRMSLTIHPSRGLFFRIRALERVNEILEKKELNPAELRWSHTTGFFQIYWQTDRYDPDGGGKLQRRI